MDQFEFDTGNSIQTIDLTTCRVKSTLLTRNDMGKAFAITE